MLNIQDPVTISQFVCNKSCATEVDKWIKGWTPKTTPKMLLITGGHGVGKSLVIRILFGNSSKYNVLNIDAHGESSQVLATSSFVVTPRSWDLKQNVLMIHDIDGVSSEQSIIKHFPKLFKKTLIPIILIANDKYHKNVSPLSKICTSVCFKVPTHTEVTKILKGIAQHNGIRITNTRISEIITQCNCDIRKSILSMSFQGCSIGYDTNMSDSIFEITKQILSQMTPLESKIELYEKDDMIPLMVHENYLSTMVKYTNPIETLDNMYASASGLSDYDICPGNCAGVLRATEHSHANGSVKFPGTYLGNISSATKNRGILSTLSQKWKTSNVRLDYLCYVIILLYSIKDIKEMVACCQQFALNKEDISDNLPRLYIKDDIYARYDYVNMPKKNKTYLTKHLSSGEQSSV